MSCLRTACTYRSSWPWLGQTGGTAGWLWHRSGCNTEGSTPRLSTSSRSHVGSCGTAAQGASEAAVNCSRPAPACCACSAHPRLQSTAVQCCACLWQQPELGKRRHVAVVEAEGVAKANGLRVVAKGSSTAAALSARDNSANNLGAQAAPPPTWAPQSRTCRKIAPVSAQQASKANSGVSSRCRLYWGLLQHPPLHSPASKAMPATAAEAAAERGRTWHRSFMPSHGEAAPKVCPQRLGSPG